MQENFEITLSNLRFFARIGVMEQERVVGNEFSVEMTVLYDASSFIEENLSSTISYADIYEVIKEEMSRTCELLESVAQRIANQTYRRWPVIHTLRISITKITPPIEGCTGSATVTLNRNYR